MKSNENHESDEDSRLYVSYSLKATDKEGNERFNNVGLFTGMHYSQLVLVEDAYQMFLRTLVDLGYGEAIERGADAAGLAEAREMIRRECPPPE